MPGAAGIGRPRIEEQARGAKELASLNDSKFRTDAFLGQAEKRPN